MQTARPLILAIHGILTGMTNPAWPWRFAAQVDKDGIDAHVETEHYRAGPFPRWNHWVTNPRVAKALANRVLLRREILGAGPVHIVAHSNGGPIAVDAAKRLAKDGVVVDTLVLVGAALHSDVEKSGITDLLESGMLLRAVAYSSPDDKVIRPLQFFPGAYGSLGARGWERDGQRTGEQLTGYAAGSPFAPVVTRWFDGFSHSEYFSGAWEAASYQTAMHDMGFDLSPLPAAA